LKNISTSWEKVYDQTGFMFSFAKSLECALAVSPWNNVIGNVTASSGFAFRMWVSETLCPSATSIWDFNQQKRWIENSGLKCSYAGRYWGQENIEKEKQKEAIAIIKKSIDSGSPAVVWNIGMPEWGLITGYDNKSQVFQTLSITGEGEMAFADLGKQEIPILSVITFTDLTERSYKEVFQGTVKFAISHLKGNEPNENTSGLAAYDLLLKHFDPSVQDELTWNHEYFLGTYAPLKYYAWKFFEKMNQPELAELYQSVYEDWINAFNQINKEIDVMEKRTEISKFLTAAYKTEQEAVEIMERVCDITSDGEF